MTSVLFLQFKDAIEDEANNGSAILANVRFEELNNFLREQDHEGNTPLHWAIAFENPSAVSLIVSKAAASNALNEVMLLTDSAGNSPLQSAIMEGQKESANIIASTLLENPETFKVVLGATNNYEASVTDMIISSEDHQFVQSIMEKDARKAFETIVSFKDAKGQNLAHRAALDQKTSILDVICTAVKNYSEISKVTSILAQDEEGNTPLHWAVEMDDSINANMLMDAAGDDFKVMMLRQDSSNNTPLNAALAGEKKVIAQVILTRILEDKILLSDVFAIKNNYNAGPLDYLLQEANQDLLVLADSYGATLKNFIDNLSVKAISETVTSEEPVIDNLNDEQAAGQENEVIVDEKIVLPISETNEKQISEREFEKATAEASYSFGYSNLTLKDFITATPTDAISAGLLGATLAVWESKQVKTATSQNGLSELVLAKQVNGVHDPFKTHEFKTPERGGSSPSKRTPPNSSRRRKKKKKVPKLLKIRTQE